MFNTPHPPFRYAKRHPLPQGERDSSSSAFFFLCQRKGIENRVRIPSPLVGEGAPKGRVRGHLSSFSPSPPIGWWDARDDDFYLHSTALEKIFLLIQIFFV